MALEFDVNHNKTAEKAVDRIQDDKATVKRLYGDENIIPHYEYPALTDLTHDSSRDPNGFKAYKQQFMVLCDRIEQLTSSFGYTPDLLDKKIRLIRAFKYELLWPGYRSLYDQEAMSYIQGHDRKYLKQNSYFYKDMKVNLEWILSDLLNKQQNARTGEDKAVVQLWTEEVIDAISVCEGGAYDDLLRIRQSLVKATGLYEFLAKVRYQEIYKMAVNYVQDTSREQGVNWMHGSDKHVNRFLCMLARRFSIDLPAITEDKVGVEERLNDRFAPRITLVDNILMITPVQNSIRMTSEWANSFLEKFYKKYTPEGVLQSLSGLFKGEIHTLYKKARQEFKKHPGKVNEITAQLKKEIEVYLVAFSASTFDAQLLMNELKVDKEVSFSAIHDYLFNVAAVMALVNEKVIQGVEYKTFMKSDYTERDEQNNVVKKTSELQVAQAGSLQWFVRFVDGVRVIRDVDSILVSLLRNNNPLDCIGFSECISSYESLSRCIEKLKEMKDECDPVDEDDREEIVKIELFIDILVKQRRVLNKERNRIVLRDNKNTLYNDSDPRSNWYALLNISDVDDLVDIATDASESERNRLYRVYLTVVFVGLSTESLNQHTVTVIESNHHLSKIIGELKDIPYSYFDYLNTFADEREIQRRIPSVLRKELSSSVVLTRLKTHSEYVNFFGNRNVASGFICDRIVGITPSFGPKCNAMLIRNYFNGANKEDEGTLKEYKSVLNAILESKKMKLEYRDPYHDVMDDLFKQYVTSFDAILSMIDSVVSKLEAKGLVEYFKHSLLFLDHFKARGKGFDLTDLYVSQSSYYSSLETIRYVDEFSRICLSNAKSLNDIMGDLENFKRVDFRKNLRDNRCFEFLMFPDSLFTSPNVARVIRNSSVDEIVTLINSITPFITSDEWKIKARNKDVIDFIKFVLNSISNPTHLMAILGRVHPCYGFSLDVFPSNREYNDYFANAIYQMSSDQFQVFNRFVNKKWPSGSDSISRGRIFASFRMPPASLFVENMFNYSIKITWYQFYDRKTDMYVDWLEKDGNEYVPTPDEFFGRVFGVDQFISGGLEKIYRYIIKHSMNRDLILGLKNPIIHGFDNDRRGKLDVKGTPLDESKALINLIKDMDDDKFEAHFLSFTAGWLQKYTSPLHKMQLILDKYNAHASKRAFTHQWVRCFRKRFENNPDFQSLISSILFDKMNDINAFTGPEIRLIRESLPTSSRLKRTLDCLDILFTTDKVLTDDWIYDPATGTLDDFFTLIGPVNSAKHKYYCRGLSVAFFAKFFEREPNDSSEAKRWLAFLLLNVTNSEFVKIPITTRFTFFDKYIAIHRDISFIDDLLKDRNHFYSSLSDRSRLLSAIMILFSFDKPARINGAVSFVVKLIQDNPNEMDGILLTLNSCYWAEVLVGLGLYPQDQAPALEWLNENNRSDVKRVTARYDAMQAERRQANLFRFWMQSESALSLPILDKLKAEEERLAKGGAFDQLFGMQIKLELAKHFASEYHRKMHTWHYTPSDLSKVFI